MLPEDGGLVLQLMSWMRMTRVRYYFQDWKASNVWGDWMESLNSSFVTQVKEFDKLKKYSDEMW